MVFLKYLCLILLFFHQSLAYFITIAPSAEECFFDRIKPNTDLLFLYEVADGGSLDIDVKIHDPNGDVIYTGQKKSDDKFTFRTKTEGIYKYCFNNVMSSVSNKILMFSLDIMTPPIKDEKDTQSKLAEMVTDLDKALTTVKLEQEYMETRDKVHRKINENTNNRVILWAMFEACVLLIMTAGQVYYLKRFFEVRRAV